MTRSREPYATPPNELGGCLGCIFAAVTLIAILMVGVILLRLTFMAVRWAWSLV
jgi:hypothetical protein